MRINTILKKYFGLSPKKVTLLEGYESINYKVDSSDGVFVCKRYQNKPRIKKQLIAEDRVLEQLRGATAFNYPKRINTLDRAPFAEEGEYIFRLLTYVEGKFIAEVPHTPALLSSLGQFLGRVDLELLNSEEEIYQARAIAWDLKYLKKSAPLLQYIKNPSDRNLVAYFFLQFEEQIRPKANQLRQSLIHNDGNDWNVLTDGNKVTGIIDFGDMCHSWLISEVAIGMVYVMMGKDQPLEHGLKVLEGYHGELPLSQVECECLYYLIAARLCISVCNSAYATHKRPESTYITISEEGAWSLLHQWLRINPLHATGRFMEVCGIEKPVRSTSLQLIRNRNLHFGKNLSLSYKDPIHMDRAAFQYMYDAQGNTFLDAYNNIMLAGHCHPKVVEAGQRAMARLNTNTRYLYDALEKYSTVLLSKFPAHLNKIFFVNSGSEATDLAIRMARYHSQKNKIMVVEHGYHGHTQASFSISSYKYKALGGNGKPTDTLETPLPKVYGSPWENNGSAGAAYAEKTLAQIKENHGNIAAFIAEPIVGCGGQVPLAKGFLNAIYPAIRQQGGVCISDEVQLGFGRLGETFWGYELYDVIPDMVVIGKPMGNGHPMGAVITTEEIVNSFEKGPEFFSSFGGNPVSCAIGLAVLEVIEEERRQEHAKKTGEYLSKGLIDLQQRHKVIGDVRGHGLFLGMELISEEGKPLTELASDLKNKLREKFVLVSTDGPFNNVIKIKPPLTFTDENAEELVSKIVSILSENMVFN